MHAKENARPCRAFLHLGAAGQPALAYRVVLGLVLTHLIADDAADGRAPTVLFWRWLMLSQDEQPAIAAAMATATQILERDAIFMRRLLFLSRGRTDILTRARTMPLMGSESSESQNIRASAVRFAQELCQTARESLHLPGTVLQEPPTI